MEKILKFLAVFAALFFSHSLLAETTKINSGALAAPTPAIQQNTKTELKSVTTDSNLLSNEELLAMIHDAEKKHKIPIGLLKSISHVESGYKQYSLNIAGKNVKAKSAAEVIEIAQRELAKGNNNIDLGVMQVNLRWHGKKFASLERMIEPLENIEYAAKLLCNLKKQYGSWHKAVRYYHSATPEHHRKYSRKVCLSWLK